MLHISLFSGIGGFDLAAQWMGWTNVASCEIAEFPRKVLQHHFPDAYHHDDIKTLSYEKIDQELKKRFGTHWRTDDIVLSGGFPCQPYSLAGKRLGKEDDRHLWPEMLRCIREIQPKWVVGENVRGLTNWNGGVVFDEVQSDLEAQGYEVQAYVLPACAVNAPHRRDRVWFIAHASDPASDRRQRAGEGFEVEKGLQPRPGTTGELEGGFERLRRKRDAPDPRSVGMSGQPTDPGTSEKTGQGRESVAQDGNTWNVRRWEGFPTTQPAIRRGDDGLSSRLDGISIFSKWRNESIKAYGNAVVPQVVYEIFKAIQEYEKL